MLPGEVALMELFLFPCSEKALVLCPPECCSRDWTDLFPLSAVCCFLSVVVEWVPPEHVGGRAPRPAPTDTQARRWERSQN